MQFASSIIPTVQKKLTCSGLFDTFCFITTWLIGEDIRVGRLETVLSDFQSYPQVDMDMGIYALYLPNRRHSLRVQTFIDLLVQRLIYLSDWEKL
jgi:DNA-binding transcriptional LysR family regulator